MNLTGYFNKIINHISIFIVAIFLLSMSSNSLAETISEPESKPAIKIIPLNISADEENTQLIKNSIGKFLMQRLNNNEISAESALIDSVKTPGVLADIYNALQSGSPHTAFKNFNQSDYICGGNITVLGSSFISDFFLYNLTSKAYSNKYSLSGDNIGSVLKAADNFSQQVTASLSPQEKIPEPVAKNSLLHKNISPVEKLIIKSQKTEGEISAVVFNQYNNSGDYCAVIAKKDEIVALNIKDNAFIPRAKLKNTKHDVIIGLVSFDTDGDGIEELIVSNLLSDKRTINSYVLAWKNGQLVKIFSNLKWIFSTTNLNNKPVLLAQKHNTLSTTLDSGIFRAEFKNDKLHLSTNPFSVPDWVKLPGLALNPKSSLFDFAAIRPGFRLQTIDKTGDIFWESGESLGGGSLYFTEPDNFERERERENRLWLSTPIKIADVFPDNKFSEIIAVKNVDTTRNLFKKIRSFKEGGIVIFSITDLGCKISAQNDKVTGHISGLDIKPSPDNTDTLIIYAVVQKGKTLFSKNKSYAVIQNINSFKRIN